MPLEKVEVKTYVIKAVCELHGLEMKVTDCLPTNPAQYVHQCPKCDNKIIGRGETYPKLVTEEIYNGK